MAAPLVPFAGCRCILVEDLRMRVFIGVLEHERQARQEVSVSIHMMVKDTGHPRSDDLADHVSYADVVAKLRERATSTRHVNLVETLAEEVAEFALTEPRVDSVIVAVRKTEIIPEAKGVGVMIHRFNKPLAGSS